MSKKGKKRPNRASSLDQHRRVGNLLQPPLAQLPMRPVSWNRDGLPEMILIDAVADRLTWDRAPGALHRIFDLLDQFVPPDSSEVLAGTISSMALIPESRRSEAVTVLEKERLFDLLLPAGLRHGLALYPDCPAIWLIAGWSVNHNVNWEEGIRYLKAAVERLWAPRGVYSTRCRMLPIARIVKHGNLHIHEGSDIPQLFSRYPGGLNKDEQLQVESMTRALYNGIGYGQDRQAAAWPAYFWRHSYRISACSRPDLVAEIGSVPDDRVTEAVDRTRQIVRRFRDSVNSIAIQAEVDLFDPDRDEVLFGLLSRQYRLFSALASDPWFWVSDLGSLIHRPMVDGFITMKWLAAQTDADIFRRFKQFSLGKLKLLNLHVRDLVDQGHDELAEFEDDLTESLNEEVWEALVSIDLGGSFSGKDMRAMAHEVDLRELYNLVYSPTSAELHGEWMSLKRHNLVRCTNPLHRFHQLPQLSPPRILAPEVVLTAAGIIRDSLAVWLDAYHLERPSDASVDLVASLSAVFSDILSDASEPSEPSVS